MLSLSLYVILLLISNMGLSDVRHTSKKQTFQGESKIKTQFLVKQHSILTKFFPIFKWDF